MSKYVCMICGFVYDEALGLPDSGIAPGTRWEQLPEDWTCPGCGAPKSAFEKKEESSGEKPAAAAAPRRDFSQESGGDSVREMTDGELAALCSNLARGCEKQYMAEESALFTQLAEYYTSRTTLPESVDFDDLMEKINRNLSEDIPAAKGMAEKDADRGAKRILVWSDKVTHMSQAVLEKYEKEGSKAFENTKIWVCDVCGFIYIGDVPPAVCPVCKVPSFKILEVTR